jgi:hypothetical protein
MTVIQGLRRSERNVRSVREQLNIHVKLPDKSYHFHNMRVEHGLSAKDDYLARPQILCLTDNIDAFLFCQFIVPVGIVRGIAVDAAKVAALVEFDLYRQ